jgi:hypothetical protein
VSAATDPASATLLADLSEDDRERRFATLQEKLPGVWAAMRSGREGESVVIVPSRVIANPDEPATASQSFEERLLSLLLLLRQPRLRVIYATSLPIDEDIVDYYLGMLPGVIPAHARARLKLVSAHDGRSVPLTRKLLERPKLIAEIRDLIPDRGLSHLVPYATTAEERDLALALGIPMYGADPRFLVLGTKSGCRKLFREEEIAHPDGAEDLHSQAEIEAELAALRRRVPSIRSAIVKLNDGVAGAGNATIDLADLPSPGAPDEAEQLARRVTGMSMEKEGLALDTYLSDFAAQGGVVEERIAGVEFRSPSVQLRVTPSGELELLSTHDQVLGGPSGQRYEGCRFPADPAYAVTITEEAAKLGERLAREGVLGRFAVDFVAVRGDSGDWRSYAIELNLRKGGTTHPYLTLEFLTGGRYDAGNGVFRAPDGTAKCLVATDHFESPSLRGLRHVDLFDVVVRDQLQFDQTRQTGIIFHKMSALAETGELGMTAIADSHPEADELYQRAERLLLEEAEEALAPASLPAI